MSASDGLVLAPGRVVLADGVRQGAAVRVEGARIADIGPLSRVRRTGDRVLADPAALLLPGLIDLHVHGGGNRSFATAGGDDLAALLAMLASWGVTAALPTLGALAPQPLAAAVGRLRALAEAPPPGGARVVGLHLEGPFLNPERAGAQDATAVRPPDPAEALRLVRLGGGWLRLMALAPELPGAREVIALLVAHGVTVAAGHTAADYEEMRAAVAAGLRQATHTCNAMRGLHHRTPGALGAALALDDVRCELIADGVHVHPAVLRVVWRAKGSERVVLISDATGPAGLPDGTYRDEHRTVTVRAGRATLPDGTLAGSCSPLFVGVRTMVDLCGVPLHEAVAMASLGPARALGLHDRTGSIAAGKDADLVLTDAQLRPRLTLVGGRVVWEA